MDKIANASIEWEEKYLRDLISERLKHFSENRVQGFQEMCDPSVEVNTALDDIIRLSMRSPRELIRLMDTIVREHDDEHANTPGTVLLLPTSIDRALDKYTTDTIKRVFTKPHLQQLQRLGKSTFINNDIQVKFKTNPQNARNRITAWSSAGLIAQTGTRAAEGGSGGKPAYEYTIIDQRVRRMVDRSISLGIDFDIPDDQMPPLVDETP